MCIRDRHQRRQSHYLYDKQNLQLNDVGVDVVLSISHRIKAIEYISDNTKALTLKSMTPDSISGDMYSLDPT